MFVDRGGTVKKMFCVFGKQCQLGVGRKLDDDRAPAGGFFLARLAVTFPVEVKGLSAAQREENECSGDERGYEVAHLSSPGSPYITTLLMPDLPESMRRGCTPPMRNASG